MLAAMTMPPIEILVEMSTCLVGESASIINYYDWNVMCLPLRRRTLNSLPQL
jgi:hypothetical protein